MAIVFTSEPVAKNTTTKNLDLIKAAECKLQEKSVEYAQNAEFEVLPDEGYDGMSKVNVSVDVVVPTVQNNKDASITSNGTIEILPDSDYDAMKKLTVQVYIQQSIENPGVSLAYYQQNSVPDNIVGWESLTDGSYKCASSELKTFDKTLSSLNIGSSMFLFCSGLEVFSSDLSALTEAENMFGSCYNIKDITLTGTLDVDLNLGGTNSSRITVDSLMSVINALVDLTGQVEKTQTIGSANLAKLTDEQKAIATNKNWILA